MTPTPAAKELLAIIRHAQQHGLMRPFSVELPDRTAAREFRASVEQSAHWSADPEVARSGGKWQVQVHRR